MSRHGIRHLPVTENGRVVDIVSERDLFALQRLSLKGVSAAIRAADDVAALAAAAQTIRQFVRSLLGQGVGARQLTELISHLNDVLTERLVQPDCHAPRPRPAPRLLAGVRFRGTQRTDDRHRSGQRDRLRERRPGARPPRLAALRA